MKQADIELQEAFHSATLAVSSDPRSGDPRRRRDIISRFAPTLPPWRASTPQSTTEQGCVDAPDHASMAR